MIKCQINNTKEKDAHSKEKEVETLEKSQPNKESQEDNLENCTIKIAELNLELEAKNKLILELLNAHRHEIKQQEQPQWWEHAAQKEPLLVKMSWDQVQKNINHLFPHVMADLNNSPDDSLKEMLSFENGEESSVTSEIVFRYMHLMEKVKKGEFKAIRPFPLGNIFLKYRKLWNRSPSSI